MTMNEENRLRTFGCVLRATRLGWYWCDKRKAYIRITPNGRDIIVEACRSFQNLDAKVPGNLHYDWTEGPDVLDLCEPLNGELADYDRWIVGEDGNVVSVA